MSEIGMKMMKTTIALVAALLLFPAASLLGQGTPITGTAGVSLSGLQRSHARGR
ncbi:MAG: hypothetical protein IPF66_05760 [Holophagales bacterium]|nr:hypothetical protein [Holophagales bacterium]